MGVDKDVDGRIEVDMEVIELVFGRSVVKIKGREISVSSPHRRQRSGGEQIVGSFSFHYYCIHLYSLISVSFLSFHYNLFTYLVKAISN